MGIFLQLGTIKSDAADANHKEWIACESMNGGVTHPMVHETGNPRHVFDASVHEIGLSMKMHKASPNVFLASLVASPCKAVVHVTRAGDPSGATNFLEVTMENTLVTHYSVDCDGDTPVENISLNFTKIEKKYKPTGADGKPVSAKPVEHDIAQH
jgi:type VI secretion system secreted protein Hcp